MRPVLAVLCAGLLAAAGCGEEAPPPDEAPLLTVRTIVQNPPAGSVEVVGEAVPLRRAGFVVRDSTGSIWVLAPAERVAETIPNQPISLEARPGRLNPQQAATLERAVVRSGAARRPELASVVAAPRTPGSVYLQAAGP